MIDTGASNWSTAGYGQYIAYKTTLNKNAQIDESKAGEINVQIRHWFYALNWLNYS
jgi:hypothetical protein